MHSAKPKMFYGASHTKAATGSLFSSTSAIPSTSSIPTQPKEPEPESFSDHNNIVLISYSVLAENKEYRGFTPTYCKKCSAALCMYSVLHSKEDYYKESLEEEKTALSDVEKAEIKDKKVGFEKDKMIQDLSGDEVVWVCEFCDEHNRLSKDVKVPETDDELYILKKAVTQEKVKEETKTEAADKQEVNLTDDTNLVFCIDVSGSMRTKYNVTKDGKTEQISRLKLVVESVLKQIEQMKETHPNRKIGLVTFDDHINIYGDCTKTKLPVNVNINDFAQLFNFSKSQKESMLSKPLKENSAHLNHALRRLSLGISTALGPGLLTALGLVQGKPGSRIIVCTDGLANAGLGALGENTVTRESQQFYDKVGDLAVDSGVSVSIITIQGNACRVDALGPLTDRTAGTILRVDPINMDLSEMASNSLIGLNVKLKAIMHKGLAFQNENPIHIAGDGSVMMKNVGSVSENNEAYFEYRVKGVKDLQKAGVNLDAIKFLPLQSQITYNDLKGNEFVRIISKQQEITKDLLEAEKDVKAEVLAGYVAKETANLALQGKTEEAMSKNVAWTGYMGKVAKNAPMNMEIQRAYEKVQMESDELNDLMFQNANLKNMKMEQQDDVQTKLYMKKQMKKK